MASCSPPSAHSPAPGQPPPQAQAAEKTAIPINEAEGTWAVKDESGHPVSPQVKTPLRARGQRGFWRSSGSEITVFLAGGWTHRIVGSSDGFQHLAHAPGGFAKEPLYSSEAVRVEGPLAGFTGVWRFNKEPDGSYLYMALDSSGAAFSTVAGLTEGRWEIA
ncbi:MAG: hypothetical protein N2322_06200, partial [Terrimicrobiaceae bacterium]|nr:hypothetical protein [Terrimicrobiaceae bacterium]